MSTRKPAYDLTIIDSDGNALFGAFSGGAITESDFQTPHDSLSHDRAYLKVPDNFTSAEIDFPEGSSTIGAVSVKVLDKRQTSTDQSTGLLTSKIDETVGARAILRRYKPGSATWITRMDGVVKNYRVDEGELVTYQFNLRDGREFERGRDLFTSNFVLWGADGEVGPLVDYGVHPPLRAVFGSAALPLLSGVEPWESVDDLGIPHFSRVEVDFDGTTVYGGFASVAVEYAPFGGGGPSVLTRTLEVPEIGQPIVDNSDGIPRYDKIWIRWRAKGSGDAWKVLRNMPALTSQGLHNVIYEEFGFNVVDIGVGDPFSLEKPAIWFGSLDSADIPADEQEIEFHVLAQNVSREHPFFWDGGSSANAGAGTLGDLLQEIVDGEHSETTPPEQYDATELTNFASNSSNARMILRDPVTDRRKWVEEHIYKAAFRAPAFDAEYEIFPAKWDLPDDTESITVLDSDTIQDVGEWEHGTDTAIGRVEYTYTREHLLSEDVYRRRNDVGDQVRVYPWDRFVEEEVELFEESSDAVAGAKTLSYEPVTIRSRGNADGEPFGGDSQHEIGHILAERAFGLVLSRFAKGVPTYRADVLATSDNLDLTMGQWVLIDVSWLPDYDSGERGIRRFMQIAGISDVSTETRRLLLVDGGVPDYTDDEDKTNPDGTDCFVTGDGTLVAAPTGASLRYFESDGDLVNNCAEAITVRLLAIAGGGGGGDGSGSEVGGGAGAGGVLDVATVTIAAGETIPVRIGAGGSVSSDGEDTVLWVDPSDGTALDPASDPAPSETTAVGGGAGGGSGGDASGSGGGSGGGGEGFFTGGVAENALGGGGTTGQGNDGGAGQGSNGSSQEESGGGGGGGSYAEAGTGGTADVAGNNASAGQGGSSTLLGDWGFMAGGGGDGGVYFRDIGGAVQTNAPGSAGDEGFGLGGGGADGSGNGASSGGDGILAVIYAGAAQSLDVPTISSMSLAGTGGIKICIDEDDWPTVEYPGYRVRIEYAVTASDASEPDADSGDWLLAGYLEDSGCVTTDPVAGGSKVWARARAEADDFRPTDWSATSTHTLAETPDLLALDLDIDDETGIGTVTWTPNSFTNGVRVRAKRHDADGDTSRDLPLIDDLVASVGTLEITSITVSREQYLTVDLEAWDTITSGYDTEVINDSPLQYLRLGEASGTTAEDASGNDNDGTYTGSPTLGTDGLLTEDPDTAVTFSPGTSDYVDVDALAGDLDANGPATVEAWFSTSATPGEFGAIIFSLHGSSASNLLRIGVHPDNGGIFVAVGSPAAEFGSGYNDGNPHHLAVTLATNGDVEVYVDGSSVGTDTSTFSGIDLTNVVHASIGQEYDPGPATSDHFDGVIDEVAFYESALSSARVAAHFNAGDDPDISTAGTEGRTRRVSHQREASDEDDDDALDNRLVLDNQLERVLDNQLNPVLDGPP